LNEREREPRLTGGAPLAPAGRWARVHRLVLPPDERAPGIPADTAAAPFEAWVNGWLEHEAAVGEQAIVRTASGRLVEGRLVEIDPAYRHSFGAPPAPLQLSARRATAIVYGRMA
jgi:hypothetical protein